MHRSLMIASAAVGLLASAGQASAADRCVVTDPTGSPLNMRTAPNGPIIGALYNKQRISYLDDTVDGRGRVWAFVRVVNGGNAGSEGYVFREFVSCY